MVDPPLVHHEFGRNETWQSDLRTAILEHGAAEVGEPEVDVDGMDLDDRARDSVGQPSARSDAPDSENEQDEIDDWLDEAYMGMRD